MIFPPARTRSLSCCDAVSPRRLSPAMPPTIARSAHAEPAPVPADLTPPSPKPSMSMPAHCRRGLCALRRAGADGLLCRRQSRLRQGRYAPHACRVPPNGAAKIPDRNSSRWRQPAMRRSTTGHAKARMPSPAKCAGRRSAGLYRRQLEENSLDARARALNFQHQHVHERLLAPGAGDGGAHGFFDRA